MGRFVCGGGAVGGSSTVPFWGRRAAGGLAVRSGPVSRCREGRVCESVATGSGLGGLERMGNFVMTLCGRVEFRRWGLEENLENQESMISGQNVERSAR